MYGLLVLCFDYSNVDVNEFNDWYDTEHIPERERTREILSAHRWLNMTNRRLSVATYDLESVEALTYSEYLAISGKNLSPWSKRIIPACKQLLRFEGRQFCPGDTLASKTANFLLLVGVKVAAGQDTDLKQAYRTHSARIVEVPGVQSARFFEGTNKSVDFLEMYELASSNVVKTKDWERADAAHGLRSLSIRTDVNLLCDRY